MKHYDIIFAEDVPHYGNVLIEAADDADAIVQAKAYDFDNAVTEPDWSYAVCKRIVNIHDEQGQCIAEEIALDDCHLRYGGETDRLLCDAAGQLAAAAEALSANALDWDGQSEHVDVRKEDFDRLTAALYAALYATKPEGRTGQ